MAAENPIEEFQLIKRIRARGLSTTDVSDTTLQTLISDALDQYLFFKPKIAITTAATAITTVADQPNYAKPTGALFIKEVAWNPDYTDDVGDVYTTIIQNELDENDLTLLELDYQEMSRMRKLFGGHWEIRNDQIWLEPCPSDVYKVAVIYGASRTLDELDRIADNRFIDLIFYKGLMAIGTSKLSTGGWRAGQVSVEARVGIETFNAGNKGLAQTLLQLSNSYTGSRS
jgi:hypothetical protein